MIQLGLIGDNIRRSKSPLLHRLAGELCGLDVRYEPLIPADLGLDFDAVFDRCAREGYRGINVTYPYKERVFPRLVMGDDETRAVGACNTVIFGAGTPQGFNTDCSGFAAAFRASFKGEAPGRVAMAGAGGVGKAIGFALSSLGAAELAIFDPDGAKAGALAGALRQSSNLSVRLVGSIEEAMAGADGLINSTPLGMVGHPGSAFPAERLRRARWAFDAVYTPVETEFLAAARAAGLAILSGYELFFHQGVDAFRLFTGVDVDQAALRAALLRPQPAMAHSA
ncbi:shikimate dehydrogenase [Aliihoeflea sp. 40Bstr573]|uniref:shikimate dehydrogenase family protein n=1 Tax=Aliihoeflea sp. 40Bstr573 TaxID=2696467 RepID=UPI0020964456|nr:shikimate dehydrogenase [Aliihoeflea sp. 40Bstr573]